MSPVLEIVVLLLVSEVEVSNQPPMAPSVAVTLPLIVAFVAVSAPAFVTE
jgi:hypothetical protein